LAKKLENDPFHDMLQTPNNNNSKEKKNSFIDMPSMTVEHKTQRTLENDPFRTVMQTPRNNAVKMTLQKDCELCDMDGCIM